MQDHQNDTDINELINYFISVIDWITITFDVTEDNMCGLEWGRLYKLYHNVQYNLQKLNKRVRELLKDRAIQKPSNIYEYVLGGEMNTELLQIRIFEESTKSVVYNKQTQIARANGISYCPLCALGSNSNRTRIYKLSEMDADHVTAWSRGGATDIDNCEMLCKTHNRAKGNK